MVETQRPSSQALQPLLYLDASTEVGWRKHNLESDRSEPQEDDKHSESGGSTRASPGSDTRNRVPFRSRQVGRVPLGTLLTPDSEHAPGKHAPNRLQPAPRHSYLGQKAASCYRKRKRPQASEGGNKLRTEPRITVPPQRTRRAEPDRSKRPAERERSVTRAGRGWGLRQEQSITEPKGRECAKTPQ